MLEEDALRFDAFLKENDEKVQEAIKHADTEAKAKQDKVRSAPRDSSTAQPSMWTAARHSTAWACHSGLQQMEVLALQVL
jgi:hypothetical protein